MRKEGREEGEERKKRLYEVQSNVSVAKSFS